METGKVHEERIKKPPVGLAVLGRVGPSFVWCAEYIGSSEAFLVFGYFCLFQIPSIL